VENHLWQISPKQLPKLVETPKEYTEGIPESTEFSRFKKDLAKPLGKMLSL